MMLEAKAYGMMLEAKAQSYDSYGLFRTTHSPNPTLYSHIMVFFQGSLHLLAPQ